MTSRMWRASVLALGLAIGAPWTAGAQDFGLMESAETIDRGTFKLRANPMLIFGKDGQDDEIGVGIQVGYGFTDRFDIEGGVAIYDNFTFIGANGEYWLVRDPDREEAFDISVIGGFHFGNGSDVTPDTRGFDLTFLGSTRVSERLELYGGLDIAFESIADIDYSYTPIHLVPGLEYRFADDVDFVAEVGLALNDEARHYLSGGIAFYFR